MKLKPALTSRLSTACLAVAATLLLPIGLRAADHGDAPALAQDQGADIADVFLFMDPAGDGKSEVVLIATVHGFITPGEAVNFGVFDPGVKYHFELFNDHVNVPSSPFLLPATSPIKKAFLAKAKANRQIDVTFSARTAGDDETGTPDNHVLPEAVRRPSPQVATVKLTGFGPRPLTFSNLPTTPPTLALGTVADPSVGAADQLQSDLAVTGATPGTVKFFAGIVDDPFFFDIPAFAGLIESVRQGSPDTTKLERGRDTFAGYNCLAIALKFPKAMLTGAGGTKVGADFMTQRYASVTNSSLGQKRGKSPAYKTIDRMGNPGINVALVPFNFKNAYNGGTIKDDISLKFAGALPTSTGIIDVLAALGVSGDASASQASKDAFGVLANIAIAYGDCLILDTNVANTGANPETGFGSAGGGRRLNDDVIDTVLTQVARALLGNSQATLGDNVGPGQDGFLPGTTFPFLHKPHQPLPRSGLKTDPDLNVNDGTRN